MKKFLLPILLVALLALTVIPAAAGQGGSGNGSGGPQTTPQPAPQGQGTMTTYRQSSPRGTFAITGKITALDAVNQTITVTVLRGNNLVKPYINTSVTVVTTAKTKFLYKESTTAVATAITFSDLAVGDAVSINGILAENVWTAKRVTKGASLSCLP